MQKRMTSLRDAPELQPFILKGVERTGKLIGNGSFGTVEELKVDHAYCAGKRIHDALLCHSEGPSYHLDKFVQESKIMKELRYPHIVQFLGLYFTDESNYPMIVMELLDNSVGKWLNSNPGDVPMSLKISILQDVAKGLHFLHTRNPPIIHRDLTAANILLTKSMSAKIADLGNAHIISSQMMSKTLSRAPGTIAYMPPEAFEIHAKYDVSLDIFSFGHLALFVMLQKSPHELLMAAYIDPADEHKMIGRSEVSRRKSFFDSLHGKLSNDDTLITLIKTCLHNNPTSRPKANKIIEILQSCLENNHDNFQEFADYTAYDFAKKIQLPEIPQGQSRSSEVIDKIKNGEGFILLLYRRKHNIFRKGSWKWKKFTFYYSETSKMLNYFGDLNKPPIQEVELSSIESVTKMKEFSFGFRIKLKKESWELKACNTEERAAWMEVLKPGSSRQAPTFTAPLPPSESDFEDTAEYELINNATIHASTNIQPAMYEAIDPSKKDDPSVYVVSATKPKPVPKPRKSSPVNDQQNISTPTGESQSQSEQESIPEINIVPDTHDSPSKSEKHKRNSVGFSKEQMELLYGMMQQFGQKPSYSDRIDPEIYDSLPEDIYDTVDDNMLYDTIPDNITPPPPPPKLKNRQERDTTTAGGVREKPLPPPKPKKLNVTSSKNPMERIQQTSSQVSTKMLILEEEEDTYTGYEHRPEWAKASITLVANKDLERKQLDDEILSMLTIDPQSIHGGVEIASGEFGKVYKATLMMADDEKMEVAVKTVKYETEKEKKNFLREMSIMSKMIHPNLVRLCGLVMEKNWIVLEYLQNGDLGTFLKHNHRSVRKLQNYMMDVAIGMHYLSNLGLVHRDLAARNILLGSDEICKISDFGMVREIKDEFYRDSVTTRLPIRWCAPESLSDRKFYPASDVWSYGILLWEMANPNEIPYEMYDNNQFAIKICQKETLDIPLDYPETVKEIMIACWQYKPEKRPSFMLIATLLTNENFRGRCMRK